MSFNKHLFNPRPQVVITAGTPIALSVSPTEEKVSAISIQAHPTNTGNIFVGGSGVVEAQCIALQPGQSMDLEIDDTSADEDLLFIDMRDVYVNGSVNGDKVNIATIDIVSVTY